MIGLSITAIGMRGLEECVGIYKKLQAPLSLDYLELAIGAPCDINRIPDDIPIVLHDRCLYDNGRRLPFNLFDKESWKFYKKFIKARGDQVIAWSIHSPLKKDVIGSVSGAYRELKDYMKLPILLENMPTTDYCNGSVGELSKKVPLLLDVSHVHIWTEGDVELTQEYVNQAMANHWVDAIHLSHNAGRRDTHDLIPSDIWFNKMIRQWANEYLVTYESLPEEYKEYQRLDKTHG